MSDDFQAIDCGDMTEIPPDLPEGEWEAVCEVKKRATQKEKFPMLALEWKTLAATGDKEDENKGFAGARVTDYVVFFPSTHKAVRMGRLRLKAMCEALDVEPPKVTAIKTWDDLQEFIDSLNGKKARIWTTVEKRKDTGDQATKVHYTQPGRKINLSAPAPSGDDDDDEDKPKGKKGGKK